AEIKEFEERCRIAGKSLEVEKPVLWYFSLEGFTEEARAYMQKKEILGSNEEMLNSLLTRYGARRLPQMYQN
ncbi:MAG: hypothetical protein QME81_00935, partial [bacterium]|nr:hypothetical protein [bacterium]